MCKISRKEVIARIVDLTNWLDAKSAMHYLYSSVQNELNSYKKQLVLMAEQNLEEIDNQVKTEFYKQIT